MVSGAGMHAAELRSPKAWCGCCRPKPLEQSAADEAIVRANLDVFRFNGFDCDIDDTAPAGRRVRLTAVPYSRSTSFSSRGPSGCPSRARVFVHMGARRVHARTDAGRS